MSSIKTNKVKIGLVVTISLALIIIIFLITGGLSPSVKAPTEPNKIVKHEKMTKKLTNEKQVSKGEVYLKSNVVVANLTLKENTTKDEAKALANKYAKELKRQYKEMPVIVDVKQGDKEIVKELVPAKEDQLAAETKAFMGVEFVRVDFKDFLQKDITKVLADEKLVDQKSYKVLEGQLIILDVKKGSKIKVILGEKTYNVVYIQ